jgi:hypothetical protein
MILRIGKAISFPRWRNVLRGEGGITFIEVMVTAVILAAGLVAIYRSFFIGLDYLQHLSCRLYALNLIENKIASAEENFRSLKDFDIGPLSETAVINNKSVEFRFTVNLEPVGNLLSVFKLDLALTWEERDRVVTISRSAYFSGITALEPGGS